MLVSKELLDKAEDIAKTTQKERALDEFVTFFDELGKKFQNRKLEIEQMKAALLLREHMLLTGKPGTGKSQLARTLLHHIINGDGEKCRVFEIQFSKFMSEDYVFGPVNIKKIREQGIIEHNTEGSIVDADFAFIDEAFDGSDVLLRSLLEIMNERTFTRNKQKIRCNLHTAILTSNWERNEKSVEAVVDRILFRSRVEPLATTSDRVRMYKNYLEFKGNGVMEMKNRLSIHNIRFLSDELQTILVESEVLKYYDEVIKEFVKQTGLYVSDRTANKALNLLRMKALMENRSSVEVEDIIFVKYCFYGREVEDSSVRVADVFDAVYEKLVIEGRAEAYEVKRLKSHANPVGQLRAVMFDTDREKNLLRMVEAENRKIQEFEKEYETLQTEKCKKQVEVWIEELKQDITKAKDELLSGGK